MDYYKELGIDRNATSSEIKSAFRSLAKKYHPDKNPTIDDTTQFNKLSEAYNVLSDLEKKAKYDKRFNAFGGFQNSTFDNGIFSGTSFGKHKPSSVKKTFTQKLSSTITLTLIETLNGVDKKQFQNVYKHECKKCNGKGGIFQECNRCGGKGLVKQNDGYISINTTCNICNGTGKQRVTRCMNCDNKGFIEKNETIEITIPEGLEQRTKLFVGGKGNYINGYRGDLYLTVEVLSDEVYCRNGNDIEMTVPIKAFDLLLEKTVTIPSIRGDININLDPLKINTPIVLNHKGTKSINSKVYGDMLIRLILIFPSLTKKQKSVLKTIEAM